MSVLKMNNKILITGGAGFIGSNFCKYWLKKYPESVIIVYDKLTYAGNVINIKDTKNENFRLVVGDIQNTDLVYNTLKKYDINAIINFAAESHVDNSIANPDVFFNTNVIGTHNLLKAAKRFWLDEKNHFKTHHFHHVSTDEVYGFLGPKDSPFTETTPYAPNSPYSASKASSDFIVRSYHETYGLFTTISNCSNNYGPNQYPEKLIPLVITNILNNKTIPMYGNGLQIRDWLHVEDHSLGIEKILFSGRNGETYNIGAHNEWTNLDLVNYICEIMDNLFLTRKGKIRKNKLYQNYKNSFYANGGTQSATLIEYVKDRLGHDNRYAIDYTKISKQLGYAPTIYFNQGLMETINWYIKNKDWVQDVKSKSNQMTLNI